MPSESSSVSISRDAKLREMLIFSLPRVQDADDEDLPPLEEDVDEGSRMEVRCYLFFLAIMQNVWHSTLP